VSLKNAPKEHHELDTTASGSRVDGEGGAKMSVRLLGKRSAAAAEPVIDLVDGDAPTSTKKRTPGTFC
jgi:hypothetical protein